MCNEYVSFDETAQAFNLSKEDVKKALNFDEALFGGFVSDDLLRVEKGEIFNVTGTGRFFIRNIAAQFDPNLRTATQHFSKAL
jgi:oxygen-independent coproporphyrinogen-3 oxidase